MQFDPPGTYSRPLKATVPDVFRKSIFMRDLAVAGAPNEHHRPILDQLADTFTRDELSEAIATVRAAAATSGSLEETADLLISLTRVKSPTSPCPTPFTDSGRRNS